MVAVAIVGASVVGAASTAYAASKGADAQTKAAQMANDRLASQYAQTREDLAPYRQLGDLGTNMLTAKIGDLTAPIKMDQATLEQTPGYQFTRTQGLKGVQNSAAARGLGASGAALKGAANFATGLADQTYQTQFNLENTNRTNAYNRLMGLVQSGGNAAAQTGQFGQQTAQAQSNNTIGAGNAQAASYLATGKAVGDAANNIGGYYTYKGLYGTPTENPLVSGATPSWSNNILMGSGG